MPVPYSQAAFASPPASVKWSSALSSELYRIDSWGAPYLTVNSSGSICVRPHGTDTVSHREIDLLEVLNKVSDLGLPLPVTVRFPDVLKNRLESLQSAFDAAVHSQGYTSHYQGVYPVKCNQDKFVVDDIVKFGSKFRFGLESGSKPELLLAMTSLCKGSPEAFLICNGYKDEQYISLALVARKLRFNAVIVLEKEEEIDLVIRISRRMCVRPVIGIRAKLRTKQSGYFGPASGEKGKFGLTTAQILRVVKKLRDFEILDCLQLLHFHIGSQIPSTALLSDGVSEAAHIYCELVRLGASMRVIDVGGGLGIDYDGSKSTDSDVSVGYGLTEYASAVVNAVRSVCDGKGVNHPVICSESGRAIVSHHSILIFEAVSATPAGESNGDSSNLKAHIQSCVDLLDKDWREEYQKLSAAAIRGDFGACVIYADQLKQRCVEQFKNGGLRMEQMAAVDGVYDLVAKAAAGPPSPDHIPAATYHVNLSIFTSIPDYWAIGQLFPIVPIHRLNERPGVRGVLSDLTCDSDGKINKFIGGESTLPLHELRGGAGAGEGYYLGMFLGGAYEEAMGGIHNLFGRPSEVRVTDGGAHGFSVTRAVSGQSCADVLRVMQHDPQVMLRALKQRAEEFAGDDEFGSTFDGTPYLVSGCAWDT
ncbi:unnamed protein product [Cuscuta campestris]|uniref:Arginine decarboxylase n=1 Tax=Cuscuta campestris TaxID=132261 RepID=A0A484LPE6_9ASTE|nr:unnamed protein product [Cuscuta campestris]